MSASSSSAAVSVAPRAVSNVERAAIENVVREAIDAEKSKQDRLYLKRFRQAENSIQEIRDAFDMRLAERLSALRQHANAVGHNLQRMLNQPTLSRADVVEGVRKNINLPLKRYEIDARGIDTLAGQSEAELDAECARVDGLLHAQELSVSPEEVYGAVLNNPTIKVQSRLAGTFNIDVLQFEERYNDRPPSPEFATFYEWLAAMVERTRDAARNDARTRALVESCRAAAADMRGKAERAALHASDVAAQELAGPLAALVDRISQLRMLRNPAFDEMTRMLHELLRTDVALEVGESDTSQDVVLARLLEACDAPNGRELLLGIANEMGFDVQRLTGLDKRTICRVLQEEAFL
ncbi:Hypothetical protein UVM_LOCUS403 [uncultured virus]|nr:Hypothetical protein UVM_LOCUS403 [uncultured virus]